MARTIDHPSVLARLCEPFRAGPRLHVRSTDEVLDDPGKALLDAATPGGMGTLVYTRRCAEGPGPNLISAVPSCVVLPIDQYLELIRRCPSPTT